MKRPIINFNRQWMEAPQELLHVLSPGVIRGQGVFETILADHGEVYFWEDHFRRLSRGVKLFKINNPFSSAQGLSLVRKALELNRLTRARVRLSVYTDQGRDFFNIVVMPYTPEAVRRFPSKTMISSYKRTKNKYSHVKSLEYDPFFAANREAKSKGFDEAILLGPGGILVEGAAANIFFVEKGALFTPSVDCGCLNGIVRQVVIRLAGQAGVPVRMGRFKTERLYGADEFFLTNSLIGIKAGGSVNNRPVGGKRKPVTVLFQELYRRYPKS